MPAYVVEKVTQGLNIARKPVNGSNVLVLGVAYKRDIDDMRESPALDIIRLLEEMGAVVNFHDPFVPSLREDGHECTSVALTPAVVSAADIVVVVTDHRAVDYQTVADHASVIIDARNVTGTLRPSRARLVSLSGGHAGVLAPADPVA